MTVDLIILAVLLPIVVALFTIYGP